MSEDQDITEITRNLLKHRSAQLMLKQVAAEIGVSEEWVKKFHQGKIDGDYKTSKAKIDKLNKYLVSKLNPTLT